jgi:hypothetical protein
MRGESHLGTACSEDENGRRIAAVDIIRVFSQDDGEAERLDRFALLADLGWPVKVRRLDGGGLELSVSVGLWREKST